MPPLTEVVDALVRVVLPAALAAAIVFVLCVKLLPARFAHAAGALALIAGFLVANHFRAAVEFRLDPERLLSPAQFAAALQAAVAPAEEAEVPPPASYWLPWSSALALAAGVVARSVHVAAAWAIRVLVVAAIAWLAVPTYLRPDALWLFPVLALVMLAEWALLERLATADDPAYPRASPPMAGALAFAAASIVLIHAHSARYTDIATIAAAAIATIAVMAILLRTDATGTIPAVAVALPSLMLVGQQDTFSEVPTAAFVLVALGPLALAPLLIPRIRTLAPRKRIAVAALLLLIPLAAAVMLAVMNESLAFE